MKEKIQHLNDVEIMDTTLRDGEQTPGVAFTPSEKLQIARMLIGQLKVDRMEVGSARVSAGERDAVSSILEWADSRDQLEAIEILGFVDGFKSINWLSEIGGKTINLLTKGSENHCVVQLRKTPQQHYNDVAKEIEYAHSKGITTNVYLEDWSNGMKNSFGYINNLLNVLKDLPVARIMLPDTLGVLAPSEVTRYLDWMYNILPNARFDFHGHNDYGLVTANSLAAVNANINAIHVTVNSLGERTGNQDLAQLVVAINDLSNRKTRVAEKFLMRASELVQHISGKRCAWNTPVTGSDVFTQTCGVHADGDKKGNLYANRLLPERFDRVRYYALGKLSGKASIDQNLETLGLDLEPEVRQKVLEAVVRLGDKKKQIAPTDLPFIIAEVLNRPLTTRCQVVDYQIMCSRNTTPKAEVTIKLDGELLTGNAKGDGGYDAFGKALRKIMRAKKITLPKLADYEVRIPPGGRTDALVETTTSWALTGGKILKTTGVDSDQLQAAIIATEKMVNSILGK